MRLASWDTPDPAGCRFDGTSIYNPQTCARCLTLIIDLCHGHQDRASIFCQKCVAGSGSSNEFATILDTCIVALREPSRFDTAVISRGRSRLPIVALRAFVKQAAGTRMRMRCQIQEVVRIPGVRSAKAFDLPQRGGEHYFVIICP